MVAQCSVEEVDGVRQPICHPVAFQCGVEGLWKGVKEAIRGVLSPDPFTQNQRVTIPGLRPAQGAKRKKIHAVSYHGAVVDLACDLYLRLAQVELELFEVPIGPYFDGDGMIDFFAVPQVLTFATREWPLPLAERVLAEAVAADPVINTDRIGVELTLESNALIDRLSLAHAHSPPTQPLDSRDLPNQPDGPARASDPPKNRKSAVGGGDGRTKLIAALTLHHQYESEGCLNPEPVGNNQLAKLAGVSPSTASAFFQDEFHGHEKYKALCRDSGRLAMTLKLLNGEYAPHDLYGRRPDDEDDRTAE